MWQHFKLTKNIYDVRLFLFVLLLFFSCYGFAKEIDSTKSPYYIDSILKHKIDTSKFKSIVSKFDIHKKTKSNVFIQQQKTKQKSIFYLVSFVVLILLCLLIRLVFDDFWTSMAEGFISFKKFTIYYQSKKYDSFIAVFCLYVLNIFILSLVLHCCSQLFITNSFINFNIQKLIQIFLLLFLFFTVINIIEYLFNSITNTTSIFLMHFLFQLFSLFFILSSVLISIIIYVYNFKFDFVFLRITAIILLSLFLVFNIIRSYQLFITTKIPYKLHFFLYICAFKIVPFLILSKYIFENIIR